MYVSNTDNTGDTLDIRDLIERIEELRGDRQTLIEDGDPAWPADPFERGDAWNDSDDGAELKALESFVAEMKGYGGSHQWEGDWYPVTLIRDSYFEEAMDELLEDIGALPKDLPGFLTVTVDYDALKMDYSSVDYDGVTYWYR